MVLLIKIKLVLIVLNFHKNSIFGYLSRNIIINNEYCKNNKNIRNFIKVNYHPQNFLRRFQATKPSIDTLSALPPHSVVLMPTLSPVCFI